METLLEFVLSNPFVLIAIIVFLVSTLRGNKEQPKRSMPSFGGDPEAEARRSQGNAAESKREPERTAYEETPVYRTQSVLPSTMEGSLTEREDLYVPTESAANYSVARRSSVPAASVPLTVNEIGSEAGAKQGLSADDVRKGIVWAEILGPPRAKRPFGKR